MKNTSLPLRSDLQAISDLILPKSRVLDLGCSDGTLLAHLVQQKRVQGRGIEITEAGVLACVRRGLSVRQGNLEEGLADYPANSFDFVILSQTIPFLSEPSKIVQEMLRVGEQAIISFPNWGYWRYRLHLLANGRFPQAEDYAPHWYADRRWQAFTVADFLHFCQAFNMDVHQSIYLADEKRLKSGVWANWWAETAVFALQKRA
ncbi:MAG: methionine biosynthesis protein MetW [Chloroflexota bacterium]